MSQRLVPRDMFILGTPSPSSAEYTSHLKINLAPSDGVVRLFKMLTYYIYAALFHRLTPCQ